MTSRGESMEEFARYAHSVQMFRKNILSYQQRIDYSKKLFEARKPVANVVSINYYFNIVSVIVPTRIISEAFVQ
jgi:hypothetical protein